LRASWQWFNEAREPEIDFEEDLKINHPKSEFECLFSNGIILRIIALSF
jgi:hypothetical protein